MIPSFRITEFTKYLRFIIGGGFSTILNLTITYALTEWAQVWHMFSFAIALGVEIIFQFLYHSVITFRKRGKFILFLLIILFISDLNWILVYLSSVNWKWNYLLSIIIVATTTSIINFIMNSSLVFQKKNGS